MDDRREHVPEGWASDRAPERRPGVPMEWEPHPDPGAHWGVPEWQRHGAEALERSGLRRVTPVFGDGEPAHGVSGFVRRRAYALPETRTRRWMLLLLADRIDAWGHRLAQASGRLPLAAAVAGVGALVVRELRRA